MRKPINGRSPLGAVSIWIVVSMGFVATALASERLAAIEGSVTGPDGAPVEDVRVVVIELGRSASTDAEGRYRIEGIPPGDYHVEASSRGLGSGVREVEVGREDLRLELVLDRSYHREQIVVSATRSGRGTGEVIQAVTAIDETRLSEQMQPTLGETLSGTGGVSSTYFGPGSSRPIIRGKGGSRVRVLEGGLGVGDASTTSPDHAVSFDPMGAERIEILRGPSSLLYGGGAVGGVVNLIDRRIPEFAPERTIAGDVALRAGSAGEEAAGSARLTGGIGAFAWRLEGLSRNTDDFDIPGNAVRDDPTSPGDTLPNSAIETDSATLGVSWVGDAGFVGVSGRTFDSRYGIPVPFEEGGETVSVQLEMDQTRLDLRGGFNTDWGRVNGIRFLLGRTDYEHREIVDDNTVGTRFENEAFEGRLEISHGEAGRYPGVFGVQLGRRDFQAIGDEAFVPPSRTEGWALFAQQDFEAGELRYQAGVRFERGELEAATVCADGSPCTSDADCTGIGEGTCSINPERDFDLFSASFGVAWVPSEDYTFSASLTRGQRAPTAEELYSDGPHLATASFEVGDRDLSEESSTGIDVNLRKRTGRLSGELSMYAQDFSDYIFEVPTGDVEDGLPVFAFSQDDVEFWGGELELLVELFHDERRDLHFEVFGDYVRTEISRTGGRLPYIPPGRVGGGLRYNGTHWSAGGRFTYVDGRGRTVVSAFDVSDFTPSYGVIDANVGYRLVTERVVHQLLLRASNASDELARVHASRLRDRVPLPGTDVALSYRVVF